VYVLSSLAREFTVRAEIASLKTVSCVRHPYAFPLTTRRHVITSVSTDRQQRRRNPLAFSSLLLLLLLLLKLRRMLARSRAVSPDERRNAVLTPSSARRGARCRAATEAKINDRYIISPASR
jgi:hypothetical protein